MDMDNSLLALYCIIGFKLVYVFRWFYANSARVPRSRSWSRVFLKGLDINTEYCIDAYLTYILRYSFLLNLNVFILSWSLIGLLIRFLYKPIAIIIGLISVIIIWKCKYAVTRLIRSPFRCVFDGVNTLHSVSTYTHMTPPMSGMIFMLSTPIQFSLHFNTHFTNAMYNNNEYNKHSAYHYTRLVSRL